MIKHEEKHKILKLLAEAGFGVVTSSLGDEGRGKFYHKIRGILELFSRLKESIPLDEAGECHCEAYETDEVLPLEDAVSALSDGHGLMKPQYAFKVCKALEVPFPKVLMHHGYSDWSDPKGMHMNEGNEGGLGIWSLQLSEYVAEKLGVKNKAGNYLGRGFQAQAYEREVRKLLVEQGKLQEVKV